MFKEGKLKFIGVVEDAAELSKVRALRSILSVTKLKSLLSTH